MIIAFLKNLNYYTAIARHLLMPSSTSVYMALVAVTLLLLLLLQLPLLTKMTIT